MANEDIMGKIGSAHQFDDYSANINGQKVGSGERTICQPVKRFVFGKIEKTGSSTAFLMLMRFVMKHNLTTLAPLPDDYIRWESCPPLVKDRFQSVNGCHIGPGKDKMADTLIYHSVYRKRNLRQLIKPNYKYIALVRDPVSWFKSAVKFFPREARNKSPREVLASDKLLYGKRRNQLLEAIPTRFHLIQLLFFGFDYQQRENLTAIKEFIANFLPRIDVVMLTEQYDASLVLLKRKFCWEFSDIFYIRSTVTNSYTSHLSDKDIEKLLSPKVNLGDKLLYDKLNESWWRQPEVREDNFWEEVRYFKEINRGIKGNCGEVLKTSSSQFIASTRWHDSIELSESFCRLILLPKSDMKSLFSEYGWGE